MKRRITQIAVLLIGGAAVNVAVAWVLALRPIPDSRTIALERVVPAWQRYREPSWAEMPSSGNLYARLGQRCIVAGAYDEAREFCLVYDVASGLPARSMSYAVTLVHDTNVHRFFDDIRLPFSIREIWFGQNGNRLPARIRRPGFVVNTLFYGGVLWLVFCGPSVLRRRLRIRGGRCPACGYPAGPAPVCSECGGRVRPIDS